MTVQVTKLANGLTVASDAMTGVESATIGVWVAAGARHEPAEVNGIAHLLEQIPYEDVPKPEIQLPDRIRHADYNRAPVPPEMHVPERY